jgi:hypothetical protein
VPSLQQISLVALCLALLAGTTAIAQVDSHEPGTADPIPPPLPPPERPEGDESRYDSILGDSDLPWGLPRDLLEPLFERAEVYRAYTRRFTCTETARLADYKDGGEAAKEKTRRYGYLLIRDPAQEDVREYRQAMAKDGSLKTSEVKDEEPFPPAYAWVFLFSRFHEPYFAYRSLGDHFDGFDWVYELHFKGSLPFTDGKDIRQWEGVALVDAATFTPLEIIAEPTGQGDRINAMYDRWAKSFNLMGMKLGKKPLGYRARIQFRHRREGLTFPTELRYDTFRAFSGMQLEPVHASIRSYDDYHITKVETEQQVGGTAD